MRLLLDTHALLWWWTDDPRLSPLARFAIADDRNEVLVSAASAWEVAIKQRIGKLNGIPQAAELFLERVAANGFRLLAMSAHHALLAGGYPQEHNDPFDRMLAAQAELEGLTLVTLDPAMAGFKCERLW